MRALGLVILGLVAGCAGGDDAPIRGAGGGGGGVGDPPDADLTSSDATSAATLTGEVCVIEDWRAPFACPAIALARGVEVTELATGGMTTTSDNTGAFRLDVIESGGATLRVGGDGGDLLVSTQSIFAAAASPVEAPAVDEGLWDTTLANLVETQTQGAGVVYVVNPTGPVAGARLTFTTGVPAGARTYYDDGADGFDLNAVATDTGGRVLLLDVQSAGVRVTLDDGRTATAQLDTGSLEIGIAVITLPVAP
jgi:hypothetical protein